MIYRERDEIEACIRNYLSEYDYELNDDNVTFKTGSIEFKDSTLDYIFTGYCGLDIYIEEIRGEAGDSSDSYVYLTYYNSSLGHEVLLREPDYSISCNSVTELVDYIMDICKEVKEDNEKITKLKNGSEVIAKALCEYIKEGGEDLTEKDLKEFLDSYLYT